VSRDRISEVGVLDKAVVLLDALARPEGPFTLVELVARTGIHRATAHRLLRALQVHGFAQIDEQTRWSLGSRLEYLGNRAASGLPLRAAAIAALTSLRDDTGESVQLYIRQGDTRVCIAGLESPHGLRTIVEVGAVLPLAHGSAGHLLQGEGPGPQGWISSVAEREAGVASVSAPVRDSHGVVRASVSVSGPIERVGREPGLIYGSNVVAAARAIETAAGWLTLPSE
jgi:DNA-binding IclR family transcriptional regulator